SSNIFFTSCGTEGINTVMNGCIHDLGIHHIITSPIEHHAVLHSIEHLVAGNNCGVSYTKLDSKGNIDLNHLELLLKQNEHSLVCLMHANNEIGNQLPLNEVSRLCSVHNALFLCDTVQTVGKLVNDFRNMYIHFAVCSAHKLHGPKGAGFLYLRDGMNINPMLLGGGQERNMRSGTENIYGIVGLAKALEVSCRDMEKITKHVKALKSRMVQLLKDNITDVAFYGESEENGLYTILNISFPKTKKSEMLLYNLDIEGIAASGGSACNSGAVNVSHVLRAIGAGEDRVAIRFSFSKFNTFDEIEKTIEILMKIL
ncbi:MAG: cysteine desulfurase family protein, partial [Bacteroidota bacterium]